MRGGEEGVNIYFGFVWRVGEGDGGRGVYEVDLVGSARLRGREEDTSFLSFVYFVYLSKFRYIGTYIQHSSLQYLTNFATRISSITQFFAMAEEIFFARAVSKRG